MLKSSSRYSIKGAINLWNSLPRVSLTNSEIMLNCSCSKFILLHHDVQATRVGIQINHKISWAKRAMKKGPSVAAALNNGRNAKRLFFRGWKFDRAQHSMDNGH